MGLLIPDVETMRADRYGSDWWPATGIARRTSSGVVVTHTSAQQLSAVWCATRIISEAMAMLPLHVMRVSGKSKNQDMGTVTYSTLHDKPNPEQDSFQFFDQQVPFQLNYGTAWAEIVRDASGEVAELWPIHPSRLPDSAIRRNGAAGHIPVGQPGELVYYVRNDDGSSSPIPASSMLRVPGVMSENGITGKSIIQWGAQSIGVSLATEQHVGGFFRNGATPDIAIKYPTKLSEEQKAELRNSWKDMHTGAGNAHNMLLLTGNVDVQTLGISPEAAQLLSARNFSVLEIARWYRVPPHLLADLSRSTYNNIESEGISFVQNTILPWVSRWEKALNSQLLGGSGQRFVKFNLSALLRADSKSQSEFFRALFGLGAMSPNEIRDSLDRNPIEGGDRYFIAGNNMVPLDQVDRMGTLDAAGAPKSRPDDDDADDEDEDDDAEETGRAALLLANKALLANAIQGLVEYECREAVRKSKDTSSFISSMEGWYAEKFSDAWNRAITPCAQSLAAAGVVLDATGARQAHVAASMERWNACLDAPMSEFAVAVAAASSEWENRGRAAAGDLMGA